MDENENMEMYLGIETDNGEDCPSLSLEIPISKNVFIYSYILNQLEKKGCLNKLC